MDNKTLKSLRLNHGLTIPEAASMVGRHKRSWMRFESGKIDIPKVLLHSFLSQINPKASRDEIDSLIPRKSVKANANDLVITPNKIAKLIVDEFQPTGKVLDPCRGAGAFHRLLPEGSDWCEITDGRDFFDYKDKVDWIISNPPYSIYDEWLEHSMRIADNIVYLVPLGKIFKSMSSIRAQFEYGGITKILVMSAKSAGFPFGYPAAAVHYKRGYKGPIDFKLADLA